MFRFIARRLLQVIPVLFVIITATFFMIRFVPGGPFTSEKALPPEILKNLEAHYGLDQPLWRNTDYLGQVIRGDLGPSFKYTNRTVNEIIADKLPSP
jgi:oligopeptide transport system permease protein